MSKKAFARFSETVTAPLAYWSGLRFYRQHRWQEAAALFEIATQKRPHHAPSHFKLGMCHYRQQTWHKAATSITTAVRLNPSRTEWVAQKKRADRECVKANPAKSTLPAAKQEALVRTLLAHDFENPNLHSHLALTLRKQGKRWQEVEALQYATELNDTVPTWHYRLGEALELMGQFREAAQSFAKAISLNSGKAGAEWHYREGYCWERASAQDPTVIQAARQAYQQAIEKDKALKAKRFGIGVFHQDRGHWEDAVAAYTHEWNQPPWDAELAYRIALSHERCDRFSQAVEWYGKALALGLENPNWHYRLGFCLEQQRRYAEAAKAYSNAINHHKQPKPAWYYRLGRVLKDAGDHQEAINAFMRYKQATDGSGGSGSCEKNRYLEQIENDEPSYVHSLINITSLTTQLVDHLTRDSTDARVWFQIGNAYKGQREWELAIDSYQQAIKRSATHNAEWHYQLAHIQSKLRRFEAASNSFSDAQAAQLNINNNFERINANDKHVIQKLYTHYRTSLPICDKTILFESFDGVNISCNPNAIFREMLRNPEYSDWQYIWTVNDLTNIPADLKGNKNVFFVKKESDPYLRALASCSHLVNNVVFRPYFHRRPEQKYLATWHGTPLKTLGKDQQQKFFDHRRAQRNFLQSTHIISPNSHTTKVFLDSYQLRYLYAGKIANLGNARVDLTLNATKERKAAILELMGITDNLPVVLYSPTWRGDIKNAFIDQARLESDIRKLTSTKYHLLFKGHSLTEEIVDRADLKCVRPPKNLDSNEILSIVDVMITDYSSIFFDFIPKKKPILYYAYDEETYRHERGLYFAFNELPGTKFTDADALAQYLNTLVDNLLVDESKYDEAIELFCNADDGKSSERALRFFLEDSDESVVNKDEAKESNNVLIAISANDLHHTGPYLVVLANAVKQSGLVPTMVFSPNEFETVKSKDQFFRQLDEVGAVYLPRCGIPNMLHRTRQQYAATREIVGLGYPTAIRSALDFAFSFELERLAGTKPFKLILDCSNGNAYFHDLFSALESKGATIQRFPNGIANALKGAKSTRELPTSGDPFHSEGTAEPSSFQTSTIAGILDRIDARDLTAAHSEDPDDVRSKLVVRLERLTMTEHGYRFWLSISTPGFDSSKIEIRRLWFRQRKRIGNEDESLVVEIADERFLKNQHSVVGEVSFEDVIVPLLYWELEATIGYQSRQGTPSEVVAHVNALDERLRETIDEYPLKLGHKLSRGDGTKTVIYPYINANDRISFVNREADSYDTTAYRIREMVAKLVYSCTKRYWDEKDIWLVFEKNSRTAQDNGFYFFQHAVAQRPNVYFVIDANANDFEITRAFKHNVIKFMSIRHMVYLLAASTLISSEARAHGYAWRRVFGEYRKALFSKRFVFLQHGVTALKNTKNIFARRNKAFAADLFIVTSPKEARIVSERLGYSSDQLVLTNFARWRNFMDTSQGKREIFLMPTWRNWLEEISDEEFLSSAYFQAYKNLLDSPDLVSVLDRHDYRLNFILHPKLAHHLARFESRTSRITIADTSKTTVRDLLSSAKILITDYSSVAWDFLYLKKPVLFYHFDRSEYEAHQGSYIDLTLDLPGEVASTAVDLIHMIDRACSSYDEFSSRALSFHVDFFGDDISARNDQGRVLDAVRSLDEISRRKKRLSHTSGPTGTETTAPAPLQSI